MKKNYVSVTSSHNTSNIYIMRENDFQTILHPVSFVR